MDHTYAETLKELIELADIKLFLVAETLGYDISYISKWCNAKKLPSVKLTPSIHQQLSNLFSKRIFEKNLCLNFYANFDLPSPVSQSEMSFATLESDIFTLLNNAYQKSSPHTLLQEPDHYLDYLVGRHVIYKHLRQSINRILSEHQDSAIEVWTNLDIFSYNAKFLLDTLQLHVSMDHRVIVHLGYNIGRYDVTLESVEEMVHILSSYSEINIEIYDSTNFHNLNFLIINRQFFANFLEDNQGFFQVLTYGTSNPAIRQLFKLVSNCFAEKNVILKLEESDAVAPTNFRTNFYSASKFLFLCNFGFEYLLPSSIVKEISDFSLKQTGSQIDASEIQKLQVTWEEVFEKAHIKFIVPKSTLFDYYETREILYCSTHYKLSQKQQQAHFNHIIRCMRVNPNIHMYVFDDFNIDAHYFKKTFNMYFNQFQFYVKNILYPSKGHTSMLSMLKHPTFIKRLSNFLDNIISSPHCREYTSQEMTEFYNKYGKMFERLQKINDQN